MDKKRPYSQDHAAWFKRERLQVDRSVTEFERRAKEHPFLCAEEARLTTQAGLRHLHKKGERLYGTDIGQYGPLIVKLALEPTDDGRAPCNGSLGACTAAIWLVDLYMAYATCLLAMEVAYGRPDIRGVHLANCVCEHYATLRRDEPRSVFTALETMQKRFPEAARREALAEALVGYFDGQLNTNPKYRLGRALQDERQALSDALPAEALAVWADRGVDELKVLRNRISEHLQQLGRESSFKGKNLGASSTIPDKGYNDELLEEFELEETLRQQLTELEEWTKQARLSEQQNKVRELDVSTNFDTEAIARELDITAGQVRKVRHDYLKRIRKAAGL